MNTLPELPKQRKKKEANFGLIFRAWIEKNPQISGAFELKQCEKSLPFSDVKDHQIASLRAVAGKGLLWKIADDSRGIKPFDYFYFRKAKAYIVIKFSDMFCLIDVNNFVLESFRDGRKSLTSERAKEIAEICVKI